MVACMAWFSTKQQFREIWETVGTAHLRLWEVRHNISARRDFGDSPVLKRPCGCINKLSEKLKMFESLFNSDLHPATGREPQPRSLCSRKPSSSQQCFQGKASRGAEAELTFNSIEDGKLLFSRHTWA